MAAEDRERLQQARELILQKRFNEARALLRALPAHPTAQQWLAKLDEIGPPPAASPLSSLAPLAPLPRSTPAAAPAASAAATAHTVRYLVSGVVMAMAVLMIIGFFVFSWMDLGNMFNAFGLGGFADALGDDGALKVTAMEIWMGRNAGEDFSLNFDQLLATQGGGSSGFANVRPLDRTLILIPVAGIVLLWLAWMYASNGIRPLVGLALMSVIALGLLAYPLAWEELTKNEWENSMNDQLGALSEMNFENGAGSELSLDPSFGEAMFGGMFGGMFVSMFAETFSTGEQALLAGIAAAACLVGLALEYILRAAAVPAARRF